MGLVAAGFTVLFLIMPAYAKLAKIPMIDILLINTIVLFVTTLLSIIFGYIGDKFNKRYILLMSSIITIVFSYKVFDQLVHHDLSLIIYSLFCVFSFGAAVAIVPSVLAESFPTEIRYTGVGVVYNLSCATTAGLAPIIIFYLISSTGNILMPAVYFITVSIIALFGVALYPKNNFSSI